MNTIQKNLFATVASVLWGLCACSGNGDSNAVLPPETDSSGGVGGDVENPQSSSAAVKANWSYLSDWADYREMTDPRDGQVYKMVKIGPFVVMAENLNYDMPSSYCYDNLPDNCGLYGRLYTWEAAIQACPAGWHLPSGDEWEALYAEMGRTLPPCRRRAFPNGPVPPTPTVFLPSLQAPTTLAASTASALASSSGVPLSTLTMTSTTGT